MRPSPLVMTVVRIGATPALHLASSIYSPEEVARMWHESRAEEKRLKGTMADRKKRAERRKKHYEEAQADPNQFLQVLPRHTACTMY